jgi:hypothetical protein
MYAKAVAVDTVQTAPSIRNPADAGAPVFACAAIGTDVIQPAATLPQYALPVQR